MVLGFSLGASVPALPGEGTQKWVGWDNALRCARGEGFQFLSFFSAYLKSPSNSEQFDSTEAGVTKGADHSQ